MHRLWTRPILAFLTALLLGVGIEAHAQDCDFEFPDGCVELPHGIPAPDRALRVEVTLSISVPGNVEVFYRPTGSGEYEVLNPEQQGNTFVIEIPAEAVTVRGLDVYGTYFDGGDLLTFPEENPVEEPIRIPVVIGSFTVPIGLPPREYRMVSVAADLGEGTAATELTDDFGEPDVARWRAARWNEALDQYEELPDVASSLVEGTAFWLVTANGGDFDINVATSSNPDSLPTITLAPDGFSQVGNPYAFPVAWDDVRGDHNIGPLLAYDPASRAYFETETLAPWTGYFVESLESQTITLVVPARESVGGAVRAPETDYVLHVEARSGEYADLNNIVGFAPAAAPGRDRLDLGEPPPIGEHVRISVMEEGERWMRSLKPEHAEGELWDVEVTASEGLLEDGSRRVTVSLGEQGIRPSSFDLYVIDRDRGTAVQVTDGTFEVVLSQAAPVRRLRLIVGTEDFARTGSEGAPLDPTAFGLDAGYPNPFAGQATIAYRLETRGRATLEVFDLLGRRVRVLADGNQNAGAHSVEWDGRDGAGRHVSSGVYLVRLRAGDASATRRVSVLR